MTPSALSKTTSPYGSSRLSVAAALWIGVVGTFLLGFHLLSSLTGWSGTYEELAQAPAAGDRLRVARIGYALSVASALLAIPAVVVTRSALDPHGQNVWLELATPLGLFAGLVKAIGLMGWQSLLLPSVARYTGVPPENIDAMVELALWRGIDRLGAAVGDVLGAALLGGAWMITMSIGLRRGMRRTAEVRALAAAGIVIGALSCARAVALFGVDANGLLAVGVPLWYGWLAFFAFVTARARHGGRTTAG